MKNVFKHEKYRTREQRIETLFAPDTFWARGFFATCIVIVCTTIDTYLLYEKWYLVMSESPAYVILAALACAIALEGPFSIFGIVLKRYHLGLCSKGSARLLGILSVAVFTIAFVMSFLFSMETKELVFEIDGTESLVNTMEEEETLQMSEQTDEDRGIMVAALFNGVLPLLTSLTVFISSYFSYSPLKGRRRQYEKERIGLQNNLMDVEKAIAEADVTYFDRLLACEEEKYQQELQLLESQNIHLKELARTILARQMSTPEENDLIALQGKELLEKQGRR